MANTLYDRGYEGVFPESSREMVAVLRSIDRHLRVLILAMRLPPLEELDLAAARRDYEQLMLRLDADPEPEPVEEPDTMEDRLNADELHDPMTVPEEIQRITAVFDTRYK